MRVILQFVPCTDKLSLPLQYNSLVQGLIYRNLDRALSDRIHDEGTPLGKRQFRFFTFSRLLGRYTIKDDTIEFTGPIKVHVGSVHEQVLQSPVEHLLGEPILRFGLSVASLLISCIIELAIARI